MCKYCDDDGELMYHKWETTYKGSKGRSVGVVLGELCIDASADTFEPNYIEESIKINFCPMCGKKFPEQTEWEYIDK